MTSGLCRPSVVCFSTAGIGLECSEWNLLRLALVDNEETGASQALMSFLWAAIGYLVSGTVTRTPK
jgi:hypothetical protein